MISSLEQMDRIFTNLAWRLWTTLGVAGDSAQYQDCFIDLESLIILTTTLGKSDPRLLEETLDWCSKFHSFISISRLRTLLEELGPQIHTPFSAFAETLNSISQSKWPTFTKIAPLKVNLKGKSLTPNCTIPALLGLRLRALFGVGARADLATFFLTQQSKPLTAADTVEIGYNKRTLADTLDSFFQAGLLTCFTVRNQKQYQLAKKEQLTSLVGELPSLVPNWRSILVVFITLRDTLSKNQNLSTVSTVVAMRNALTSLKDHLQKLNISPPPLSSDLADWELFIQWTFDILKDLVNEGRFKKATPITNNFEGTLSSFMQHLYKADDCIDGLEFIINSAAEHPIKHQKIFKECYQMSSCYLEELQSRLEDLLKFPIHLFMDVKLAETMYKYSQEQMQSLLLFARNTPPSIEISLAGVAIIWYKTLEVELNKVRRFIYEIKERLKKIHFLKTNTHLLSQSTALHKRHTVLKLFASV
ncbi:MAG: hypothetical protein K2Y01_04740 [Rhabdochlamydiaceae bacterium]|nr:hypothetical protein [Rhabdochlamydiaceae bacterium]